MKLFVSLITLLMLIGCNPGTVDSYPNIDNARMQSINDVLDATENCDPLPKPGLEDATSIGSTFSYRSCNSVCSENHSVLPKETSPNSYLAFPTPGYLGIGRCRGHAITTQQFSTLAIWDKNPSEARCGPNKLNRECLNLYREIIEDITSGEKVREIPGFRSLLEFSAHPAFRDTLYQKVVGYSHKYSAGAGYTEPKTNSQTKNIFYELFKRTKNGQRPYIGIRSLAIQDHAVVAEKAVYLNGEQALCISDPNKRNYETYKNNVCDNYIVLRNGSPVYLAEGTAHTLGKFNLFSDEDNRTIKYVKAWKERCLQIAENSGECKPNGPVPEGKDQVIKQNSEFADNKSGESL